MKLKQLLKLCDKEAPVEVIWYAYGEFYDRAEDKPQEIIKNTKTCFLDVKVIAVNVDFITKNLRIECEVCR